MARINLAQAINLNLMKRVNGRPVPVTLELKRGINDIPEILKTHPDIDEAMVLNHPYILTHVKEGSISLIPDPMDPEAAAAAAEEIARRARAEAEAAKALKLAKEKEIEDALAKAADEASAQARAEAEAAKALGDSTISEQPAGEKPAA